MNGSQPGVPFITQIMPDAVHSTPDIVLPLILTATFKLGMHTQFTDEKNGVTSYFRRGYLTGVLKQECDLGGLHVNSSVSHKGTVALRSVTLDLKSAYQLCDLRQVIETHLQQQWE